MSSLYLTYGWYANLIRMSYGLEMHLSLPFFGKKNLNLTLVLYFMMYYNTYLQAVRPNFLLPTSCLTPLFPSRNSSGSTLGSKRNRPNISG